MLRVSVSAFKKIQAEMKKKLRRESELSKLKYEKYIRYKTKLQKRIQLS